MSSDRPYQSQLLTSLNRTAQRAKHQAGLLWRNFKVSVTWGAQLALYPFYAVVKASRLMGKQLGQTWRSEGLRLSAWNFERSYPPARCRRADPNCPHGTDAA
jgi:hypothetical protein